MKTELEKMLSRLAVAGFVAVTVRYGGAKPAGTNAPPQVVGLVQGGSAVSALVEDGSSASLTSGEDAASPLADAPSSASISNWTARGAYCDWERIEFPDAFQFPVGTNFIDAVTLFAWGEARIKRGSAVSALVEDGSSASSTSGEDAASPLSGAPSTFTYSLPARVSLEPNASSVTHGLTPSNSYLFAWHDACVERCATNRVDASIELFRSGAVAITTQPTNGLPTTIYQLPTMPEGYYGNGQDEAWIRATFPDEAEHILAMGYENWLLNDYVGINEQNGHYLARVTVAALPEDGSPCYLVCGPYKVNVTQPGTYGFPLEVCEVYEARTYPTALPMTMAYDDGYRGAGVSHEIVDLTPRPLLLMGAPLMSSFLAKTWFKWKDLPRVIVEPARIAYEETPDAILHLWSNLGRTNDVHFSFDDLINESILILTHDEVRLQRAIEAGYYDVMAYCHAKRAEGHFVVDQRVRYDAEVFRGEAQHHESDTNGIYEVLTVQSQSGSTDARHGSMTVTVPGGQSALVSVLFASQETLMPDQFKYNDGVSWSVTCGDDTVTEGSASVAGASASNGAVAFPYEMLISAGCVSCVCVDAPEGQPLTLTLEGAAYNARDGLRQSCVQIVVESWDANAVE